MNQSRVLLVEDNAAVRNATRMLLVSAGYQVTAVASLAEALEAAADGSGVDLLVTDYHLSNGETGVQVIASLRQLFERPLPAVLMSGDASAVVSSLPPDPLTRVAGKPVDSAQFLILLQELLAHR